IDQSDIFNVNSIHDCCIRHGEMIPETPSVKQYQSGNLFPDGSLEAKTRPRTTSTLSLEKP
ncbi:MAG: hypothetical protein AB7U20_23670, partial [Planctomycetaceae bacterium]